MLKNSKAILLNAITMGALLANGGVGTEGEDDKQKKDLRSPLYNDHAPYIRSILSGVDERADMRRDLLRKPIKVDLRGETIRGVLPFQKVLNTLLVDAQKYSVPLTLTLLNATEAEISELLNHKNAPFISELDWSYEAPLIDNMDAYDFLEDEKTDGTNETIGFTPTPEDSDEEWVDETTEPTPTSDDSDEEWVDDPVGFTPEDSDEEWVDETIESTPTSDDSDEEWVDDPVGFTPEDSDEEWVDETIESTPMSDDSDEEWVDDPVGFTPEDSDEEWVDDPDEEIVYDFVGFNSEGSDEEWVDDPMRVVGDDDPEEEWVYDLLGFMRDGADEDINDPLRLIREHFVDEEQVEDPDGVARVKPRMPRLRKAVARAKYMPSLQDLVENFGQGKIVDLSKEIVVDKDILANEDYLANEVYDNPLSVWGMTPFKNAEKNNEPDVQDSNQLKNLIKQHASHNLVQIFCQGN